MTASVMLREGAVDVCGQLLVPGVDGIDDARGVQGSRVCVTLDATRPNCGEETGKERLLVLERVLV